MQRPRPVVTAAGFTGLATSIAGILAFLGYSQAAGSVSGAAQGIGAGVIGLLGVGSHLIAAFHSQSSVTPLSDPRDALGRSLTAVDEGVRAVSGMFGVGPVESALARVSNVLETAVHALAASTPASTPASTSAGSSAYLTGGYGGVSVSGGSGGGGEVSWSASDMAAVVTGKSDGSVEAKDDSGDQVEPGGEGSTHGGLREEGAEAEPADDPAGKHAAVEGVPELGVPPIVAPAGGGVTH